MEQHQGTPIGVAILGIGELSTIAKAEGLVAHLCRNSMITFVTASGSSTNTNGIPSPFSMYRIRDSSQWMAVRRQFPARSHP